MSWQIILVLVLTFIITLIGTIGYSVRIVGIRTGKIAVSFALFNIFMLVSRTSAQFQMPLLTKYVEKGQNSNIMTVFNMVLFASLIATIVGALLVPSFQRLLSKGVNAFSENRSITKLVIHSFSKSGIKQFKECAKIPEVKTLTKINIRELPIKILIFNVISTSIILVGSISAIYAGSIEPNLRATCITLAGIINGVATILSTVFIDPHLSIMTDDVIGGKCSELQFRRCIVGMVGSRVVGAILSFVILVPAAHIIAYISKII